MARPSLWEELNWRGLVHQTTSPDLPAKLDTDFLTAYIGFDPTADSLHIGSLLQMTTMRRLQRAGHRVIGLVGGGTGMIGDPSFKSDERVLLDDGTLERNSAAIRQQIESFLEGPGEGGARGACLPRRHRLDQLLAADLHRCAMGRLQAVWHRPRTRSLGLRELS